MLYVGVASFEPQPVLRDTPGPETCFSPTQQVFVVVFTHHVAAMPPTVPSCVCSSDVHPGRSRRRVGPQPHSGRHRDTVHWKWPCHSLIPWWQAVVCGLLPKMVLLMLTSGIGSWDVFCFTFSCSCRAFTFCAAATGMRSYYPRDMPYARKRRMYLYQVFPRLSTRPNRIHSK